MHPRCYQLCAQAKLITGVHREESVRSLPRRSERTQRYPALVLEAARCLRLKVLCLPQAEGGDSAGILQPPVFRRLGISRRCHVFAHLVEVMGLRRGCGDVPLFDLLGSDVADLIDVLQRALDQQEAGIRDQ